MAKGDLRRRHQSPCGSRFTAWRKESKAFADADVHRSHEIFKEQLLGRVPLAASAMSMLEQKRDGRIRKEFLLDVLDEHFSDSEAERQFQTLVDWGRYAHLFEYDANEERLYLAEDEEEEEAAASR